MTKISVNDVKKLAKLSALDLSESEIALMQKDLSHILEYVEQLESVNTDSTVPTYQVHSLSTVTRPDEVIEYGVTQVELLKNTPEERDGSIVVPRVLE